MINSLCIATNNITNFVNNINKKNCKQSIIEINQLLDQYKSEAEHHLFRVLFSAIDFSNIDFKNSKDFYKCHLLSNEINAKISKPNFSSLICRAIDSPFSHQKSLKSSNQLIQQLSKLLKLTKVQEVVIGLCLTQSTNKDLVVFANQWVRQKLPDLLRSYVDGDSSGKEGSGVFNDISMELLHLILSYLMNDNDKFGIGQDQIGAFFIALAKDFPKEGVPLVLSAVLDNVDDVISERTVRNSSYDPIDVHHLSNILEEAGPIVTQSADELQSILRDFDQKNINPSVIAKCICLFMRGFDNSTSESTIWNFDNFFSSIYDKNASLNKRQIIEELDCVEFDASSRLSLKTLHICIINCVNTFPIDFFYSQWKNPVAQFSFLKSALVNQDIIFLPSWNHRSCDLTRSTRVEDEQSENQISYWKNLDYIDALLKLSDLGLLNEVDELFDIPMTQFPHVLACCLMQSTLINDFKLRLLSKLFLTFIMNSNVSSSFFLSAWKNPECKPLILSALFTYYKESENNFKNLSCVSRIADCISEIKAVYYILPTNSNGWYQNIFRANLAHFRYEAVHFALDIVIYCTKKNSDFLSQWVKELLLKENGQVQNFKALVSYVHFRYPKLIDTEDSKFIVPRELILDAQCLLEFLKNLDQIAKIQFQSDIIIKSEMYTINLMINKLLLLISPIGAQSIGANVRQASSNPTPKVSTNKLDPTRSAFVPQSKMNRVESAVAIDTQLRPEFGQVAFNEMKSMESSSSKYVLQARPGNLSEDKVPPQTIEQELDKNLKALFEGSISLQMMCDIYCNPAKSKREHLLQLVKVLLEELQYIFQYPEKQGKIYSDLFISILNLDSSLIPKSDINKIYDNLLCMQNSLNNSNNNGREIVERIINFANQNQSKRATEDMSIVSLNTVTAPNVFGNMDSPPENVTERVFFIINNVSKMNVQEKAALLSEVVSQEYVVWFAQYIVMKRVTTEANFHDLFIQLIDCMSDQLSTLKEKVLTETYRNIKILLANMKSDLSDFNDRQLLKNLGKFLGMITLAKNKPILHDDMNLKDMLYEAYNKGHIELHYVVPFVTKTLEAAKDSIVFRPPCPWTTAILKVLKELHDVESVKLNLKFEVEILCRNLKIDFHKLTAAFFLNDRNVRIETSLCRIVSSNTCQPASLSSAAELIHNDNLANQGTFDSHSNHPNRVTSSSQQRQNVDTLEINRLSLNRPNLSSYQQSNNPSQSSTVHNYQNVMAMRSSNQDVPQYYPVASSGVGPVNYSSGQIANQQLNNVGIIDHSHPTIMRSMAISYEELNTNNIASYLNIEDIPAPILLQIPNLKSQLTATMERIVSELVSPLYDRCAKITIGTVDQLVVKDFGSDCDISTIKQYAFGMCRNLTAGLCLVTAREIVGVNLNTAVKQTILGEYRHVNIQDKEQVDNFANKIVSTNNEICVAYLQKVVSEKAIVELEKKLNNTIGTDAQKRNQLKPTTQELQVYECFSRHIPGFPSIPNPLHTTSNIPGSWNPAPMNIMQQRPQISRQYPAASNSDNMAENPISRMITEIERQMNVINSITRNDTIIRNLRQIIDIAYLALQNNDPQLIHRLMRETVSSFMTMYHSQILRDCPQGLEIMERLKEAHMQSLRIMQPYEETSGFMSVNKQVTLAWSNMDEPKQIRQNGPGKWNGEAFSELLKTHVISLPAMDLFLAKKILEPNLSAIIFVLDLLKYFVTGEKREFTVLNEFDLSSTIDAINQILQHNQLKLPPDVTKLLSMNMMKINQLMDLGTLEKTVSSIYLYNGISLSREFDDPPTMPERSEIMIRMWMDHYCSPNQRDNVHIQNIIANMIHHQLIHNDESFVRFLRLASVYVVERAHKQLKQDTTGGGSGANRSASYTEIDAYAFLVCSLIHKSNLNKNDVNGKSCLLNKSLGIIAGTLLQEHEVRRDWFHPMPFQRILIMLFNELQMSIEEESQPYELQMHVLTAFAHIFHVIRPKCSPSFVFSWLELISHRSFISKMLQHEITHSMFIQLLSDLFLFLRPYLENLHLPRPVQMIYKGAVSLTCLLMHDFPDILINYHSLLCTILPVNCYQLRNIILCTSPKMMKFPDVTRPIHVEQLSQIEDPTGFCMYAGNRIKPIELRQELDSYLASRVPVKFLSELINSLKIDVVSSQTSSNISIISAKEVSSVINVPEEHITRAAYLFKSNGVMHYDVELMNNVVLYLCITAVRVLRDKNIPLNINTIAHTAQMDIIQSLVLNLDNEGRFLLLNCMANQLRYPNSHSYYFIFTFLYLFAEQLQESVKEQITRVILERIIVNRPHPWGLLHLMNELFKSPLFWSHKFLHCSEDVEKILDSVVKGCQRGAAPPPSLGPLIQSNAVTTDDIMVIISESS